MANLFDDCKTVSPNIKCILFSILLALIYWYPLSGGNSRVLNLFYTSLIFLTLISWYKLYYECSISLQMIVAVTALITFLSVVVPKKNPFILVFILYFAYIFQAWWDYTFGCQYGLLQPTFFPFGNYVYLPFKDPSYKARYDAMCVEKKTKIEKVNLISGLVLLGIILVIVGGYGLKKTL